MMWAALTQVLIFRSRRTMGAIAWSGRAAAEHQLCPLFQDDFISINSDQAKLPRFSISEQFQRTIRASHGANVLQYGAAVYSRSFSFNMP
jgi:hypothetical protein